MFSLKLQLFKELMHEFGILEQNINITLNSLIYVREYVAELYVISNYNLKVR